MQVGRAFGSRAALRARPGRALPAGASPGGSGARERAAHGDQRGRGTGAAGSTGAAGVAAPGAYLLDPSPAVTRAGLVAGLARSLGAWQIDPMIAFLSTDEPVRTPFARTMRVLASASWHEKKFARRLRELGIGSADIRRRGLAGDVAQIHRRLGLRGDGAATVVLTRVADQPWGLICGPADQPPG